MCALPVNASNMDDNILFKHAVRNIIDCTQHTNDTAKQQTE